MNLEFLQHRSMEANTDPTRAIRYLVGSKLPLVEFGLAAGCGWDVILIKLYSGLLR